LSALVVVTAATRALFGIQGKVADVNDAEMMVTLQMFDAKARRKTAKSGKAFAKWADEEAAGRALLAALKSGEIDPDEFMASEYPEGVAYYMNGGR
jgi:hypothetical protein